MSELYSSGVINIPNVTGNIVITATATAAPVASISAVYTQSGTVYNTDSLDSLKDDLVVTASYEGGTSGVVDEEDYTLSGTLTVGTSTVTVSYSGKSDTFTVDVSVPEYPKTIIASSDGVGFGNASLTAPTYRDWENPARVHLQGSSILGYPVQYGKSYRISISNYSNQQLGVQTFNETARQNILNSENIGTINRSDSGWKSMTSGVYTHTPNKVSGSDPSFIWIVFKKSDGSNWTGGISNVEMFPITIEEI